MAGPSRGLQCCSLVEAGHAPAAATSDKRQFMSTFAPGLSLQPAAAPAPARVARSHTTGSTPHVRLQPAFRAACSPSACPTRYGAATGTSAGWAASVPGRACPLNAPGASYARERWLPQGPVALSSKASA